MNDAPRPLHGSHPACPTGIEGNLLGDLQEQIQKLSLDLTEAFEALTLVYRTVTNLGELFRIEDITAYLVKNGMEAVGASSAALFVPHTDGSFDVQSAVGDAGDRVSDDSVARLFRQGRPAFVQGNAAADCTRPGCRVIRHLLAAPLETGGRALGVLVLLRDEGEQFTTGDAKLVGALCGATAVAVANFQHYRAVSYEREMLEGVIHAIGDGIAVAGDGWRSRLTNSAARRFLDLAEDDGEGHDLIALLERFQLSVPIEAVRDCGEPLDFLAERRDGGPPLVLGCRTFRARLGAEGEPIHVLCVSDVTRQHREAAAQRDFLSLASHKLRTPLTKILGLLPLARDGEAGEELREDAFRGIQSGADELNELVEGILRFVEFRQGERVCRFVDLDEVLAEALEAVRSRRSDRRVHAEVRVDPATPRVAGSRLMLYTVFYHLLDNAVKFSRAEVARVRVLVAPEDGERVSITVEDEGEGLARDVLERIFEPFAQRDDDFTGQKEGAGLGLMLVREAVERHGGTLTARSSKGKGCCFTAMIRVQGADGASDPPRQVAPAAAPARVPVVEGRG